MVSNAQYCHLSNKGEILWSPRKALIVGMIFQSRLLIPKISVVNELSWFSLTSDGSSKIIGKKVLIKLIKPTTYYWFLYKCKRLLLGSNFHYKLKLPNAFHNHCKKSEFNLITQLFLRGKRPIWVMTFLGLDKMLSSKH